MTRAAVLAVIIAAAAVAEAAPPTDVRAYCASKWTEYTMQAYCVDREQVAQRNLTRPKDDVVYSRCWKKWDSWTMVDYCVRQEETAKARLQGGGTAAPPAVSGPAPTAGVTPAGANRDLVFACSEFAKAGQHLVDGATRSTFQLNAELRPAYDAAERSGDNFLRQKIGAVMGGSSRAVPEVLNYCDRTLRGPSTPLTQQEIDAQTKRAAGQTGAKKCETKSYGGGAAVTVCE